MFCKNPTPYPLLNRALEELLLQIRRQLGDNFLGAYLHGSFATGDFTESSDVDVLVVIKRDLTHVEIPAFQRLHQKLFCTLPKPWGQRIELSYAPVSILRHWRGVPQDPEDSPRPGDWVDPAMNTWARGYPFWYLDNGADTLVRSEHDDSSVVRWVVRERGIILMGPDPTTFIDPITHKYLAAYNRDLLRLVDEKWANEDAINTRMLQTFFVTLCVRALHTLETGTVASKKAATAWAMKALDGHWHALIDRAWIAWQSSRDSLSQLPNREDTVQTISFIRYALERADAILGGAFPTVNE